MGDLHQIDPSPLTRENLDGVLASLLLLSRA
jgi:hypothetical protein